MIKCSWFVNMKHEILDFFVSFRTPLHLKARRFAAGRFSGLGSVFVRVAMSNGLEGVNAGKEGNNDFRVEVAA